MKRSISLLVLLMVASLVTGCFGFLGFGTTYSVEVKWDEAMGNVDVPKNLDKIKDGTKITLKADPKDGFEFVEWKGEGVPKDSNKLELEIVVEKDLEIEAVFAKIVDEEDPVDPVDPQTYSVTVTFDADMGKVTVPENLDEVEAGTEITLTAEANEGYKFVEWKGTGVPDNSTDAALKIEVNADMNIEAVFEADPELVKNGDLSAGLEHWVPNGNWNGEPKVSIDENVFLTGSQSLLVSERKDTGHGLRQYIDGFEAGKTYEVSFTLLYEEGPDQRNFFISVETDSSGIKNLAGTWGGPPSGIKGEWATISNTYTFDEDIEFGDNPYIFIETTWNDVQDPVDDHMDFWVDNVSIVLVD